MSLFSDEEDLLPKVNLNNKAFKPATNLWLSFNIDLNLWACKLNQGLIQPWIELA